MSGIAILGAGETGATLARRLAEAAAFPEIWLVDADLGRAQGKALDLRQAGPVEGCDTPIHGVAALDRLPAVDALVLADPPSLPQGSPDLGPPDSFLRTLLRAVGGGFLLEATEQGAAFVASAVAAGHPAAKVAGSFPLAFAGALRVALAEELQASPGDLSLTLLGLPPERPILPRGSATLGGVPVERLSPLAERRALATATGRRRGPVALATAAADVLHAVFGSATVVRPVFAVLQGEYGHRRTALAVPARLGRGRVQEVVEVGLDPKDRAVFDTLAERLSDRAR